MQKYRPLTERILRESNLSPDFSFIIWVESRFDTDAYNRSSGAAGLCSCFRQQPGITVSGWTGE